MEIHLRITDLLQLKDKMKEGALLIKDLCEETDKKISEIISSEWDDSQARNFQLHWEQENRSKLLGLSQTMSDFSKYINKKTMVAQRYLSKSIN